MMFRMPAIFLTINPDDLQNYQIVVYALEGKECTSGSVDQNELSEDDIVADFKIRKDASAIYAVMIAYQYVG